MRVPQLVSDFFEWRWAPCVGLTTGSLAFVVLALLLIPTRFGGEPRVANTLSAFDNSRSPRALYSSSLARNLTEPEEARLEPAPVAHPRPPPAPRRIETGAPPARGFSPILDRPEPPTPPPAPPPMPTLAVEPPAPVPGTVVVIQPEPGGPSREVTVQ
jgi:hypothetical protein